LGRSLRVFWVKSESLRSNRSEVSQQSGLTSKNHGLSTIDCTKIGLGMEVVCGVHDATYGA